MATRKPVEKIRLEKAEEPKQKSNAKFKDTILRALCKKPKRAIELVNAVTGSNYPPTATVKICDLSESLSGLFNDVGLFIDGQLIVLIEHQSSPPTNLPLRFLLYFTDILFSWFVKMGELYKSKPYKIPTPKFYVLYNGTDKLKQTELKLSDAFIMPDEMSGLELTVQVFDVNYDSGSELLEKSEMMAGYSYLIDQIRRQMEAGDKRDRAIRKAVEICIEENILVDFLKENYEEVIKMFDIQYSKEAENRAIREEERENGINNSIEMGLKYGATQESIILDLAQLYGLNHQQAQFHVNNYTSQK